MSLVLQDINYVLDLLDEPLMFMRRDWFINNKCMNS